MLANPYVFFHGLHELKIFNSELFLIGSESEKIFGMCSLSYLPDNQKSFRDFCPVEKVSPDISPSLCFIYRILLSRDCDPGRLFFFDDPCHMSRFSRFGKHKTELMASNDPGNLYPSSKWGPNIFYIVCFSSIVRFHQFTRVHKNI